MRRLSIVLGMLVLLMASSAMANGPLLVFDPATKTPYRWPGAISIYTDLDVNFSTTGPVTNADATARVADAAAQWTAVPTASLSIAVAGNFSAVGLPEINLSNFNLVLSTFNGGGYHIIYDSDGAIVANLAGPGVLGFSGPEWVTGADIDEAYAVMNGSSVEPGDVLGTWWQGVFTHEMGHALNLAHTQTNGAVGFFGDDIGPTNCATPYGGFPLVTDLETMYPFIDPSVGTGSGPAQGTVDMLDDMGALSDIYPDAGWPTNNGTISGIIYASDGSTEITGVNVIVRNLANPWGDCSSMLSGANSQGGAGPDGSYVFNGLTPGATYVVYVDQIVAGGFSTTPVTLPGPEEFYNGGSESSDPSIDDKCGYTGLQVAANQTIGADIIFNTELNLGDDDSQEVTLPFPFTLCGTAYTSVWVGSNGFVTFGAPNTDYSPSVADLLSGPARIAPLWIDLNPTAGGNITAGPVGPNFVITFAGVPQYSMTDSNSFVLTLRPDNTFNIDYPGFDATGGLVGTSLGFGIANDPGEIDLSTASEPISGVAGDAVYEFFESADNDLSGDNLEWGTCPDYNPSIANAQMGVLYATTGAGGGSLYVLDPYTGAATLIGPTGLNGVPGLAINSSGEIWGTERSSGSLYRIDATTGQAFFQTTTDIGFLDAIAFDGSDVLYGVGFDPPDYELRTINTSTGVTTPVGPTGDVFAGLAFHPVTGVLYGSTGGFQPNNPDGIAKIDKSTGATTFLGTTGFGSATPDICFDTSANLFGVKGGGQSTNNLILVNQLTGAGTLVGPTGVPGFSGMASYIQMAVPTLLQSFDAEPGDGAVTLRWTVHTTGNDLLGFRVYRREPGGSFATVNDVPLAQNVRSFVDDTVAPGKRYVYKLEIVNDGQEFFSPEVPVQVKALKLELAQCTPNPFNPTTTIGFTVPSRVNVTLQIFDVAGRLVTTLVSESRDAGRYSATWTGRDASGAQVGSGVYFYKLSAGSHSLTRKMVLLK